MGDPQGRFPNGEETLYIGRIILASWIFLGLACRGRTARVGRAASVPPRGAKVKAKKTASARTTKDSLKE